MLDNSPKISVCIITYNQEKIVGRTLESLISQKDYLYEICINDDCSSDGTFDVLLEYQRRYPGLVKPFRNEHNLGIFENVEVAWKRLEGDVVCTMAGDDEVGAGYFKEVLGFIKQNRIDYKNELFCIYGDYKEIEPDGSSIVYSNKLVKKHDALKLTIRKLISIRSACYSKRVLDRFERVSEGRSYGAESVQDCQLALFSEKNYYIPVVGNIYYAGIGVSSKMNKKVRSDITNEGLRRCVKFIEDHGRKLDQKDLYFIEFIKAYRANEKKKSLYYFFKSIDFSLGVRGLGLDRIVFVFLKKFRCNKLLQL